MFCKEKHDVVINIIENECYIYFNYDFVQTTTQELDSNGALVEVSGYECTSYGKKFAYRPSVEEILTIYNEIAERYGHTKAEKPTIVVKEG